MPDVEKLEELLPELETLADRHSKRGSLYGTFAKALVAVITYLSTEEHARRLREDEND